MQRMTIALVAMLAVACADQDAELSESQQPVSVAWTAVVGASASGSNLTKTSSTLSWNAGAISVQSLNGNGYAEFSSAETTTAKMAGLGVGNSSTNYTDIEYGFYLLAGGSVRIYEAGAYRGQFGTYAAGDTFRVEVVGAQVQYSIRGTVVYTSTIPPTFPLVLDTALYTPGATIQNAQIVDTTIPFWTSQVNVSAIGNSITKTSGVGWNSGAVTTTSITNDGFVEFTSGEITTAKMAGLSNGNQGTSYQEIDYAFYLMPGGSVRVYENGAFRKEVGTYVAGDAFRIELAGSVVTYVLRGAVVYTSTIAPTRPLLFDTALYTAGGTIRNVVFGDTVGQAIWDKPTGVVTTPTSLTKTAANGWNAGAATVASLSSDGYVQFTTGETTTAKMVGLGNGNPSVNYTDIEYAFYLMSGGSVRIYESGAYRGEFGSYTAGDTFRVEVVGTQVRYAINDAVVYTSAVAATFPLVFDSALYTVGATVQDVTLTRGVSCSYTEADDAGNDDLFGTGMAEDTGIDFGTNTVAFCGRFDSGHYATANSNVDVDSYTFTVPAGTRGILYLNAPNGGALDTMLVEIFGLTAFSSEVGQNAGTFAVTAAELPPGEYEITVSAYDGAPLANAIDYKLTLQLDSATRCATSTASGYAEAGETSAGGGNDVYEIRYSGTPARRFTSLSTDAAEATGIAVGAGSVQRITGASSVFATAPASWLDSYMDRDTYAITTGPTTNQLAVRLNWPGSTADLDFFVFDAGAIYERAAGWYMSNVEDEFTTLAVTPNTTYWIVVGAIDGSSGQPVNYGLTLCGDAVTVP